MQIERLTRDAIGTAAFDADVDAIMALEHASFTNPWPRETLVWELQNSDVTRVYLARDDARRVFAFCTCWVIFDELHINTVAVAPQDRRKGVGTALLRHVMADASAAGARKATLEVRASNEAALATYSRLGFRVAARRPAYYSNPDEDGLVLWNDDLPNSQY